MDGLDSAKCQIQDLRTWKTLFESLMNETKESIVSSSSSIKRAKTCNVLEGGDAVGWNFSFFLEREHFLFRIPVDQTVDFRRSKKESCSTQRGIHMDTNLVEFRQLQEVGIFSYFRYSLAKSHVNG